MLMADVARQYIGGRQRFTQVMGQRAKADNVSNEEMAKLSQGLPLPAGFKLPF